VFPAQLNFYEGGKGIIRDIDVKEGRKMDN